MNKKIPFTGADILLPKEGFEKWSVIACDQYTSEPEYWKKAEEIVGKRSLSAENNASGGLPQRGRRRGENCENQPYHEGVP